MRYTSESEADICIQDQQIEFNHLFTRKCESFAFQVPFSDGEIYRKIRTMPIDNHDWASRLSKCKKPILKALLRHRQLTEALDRLLPFPGLWRGLQLGNIHKHLALHWDEELLNYLTYVFDTWDNITNGNNALKQAVDVDTVRSLQYLIPSGCDAHAISALFRQGKLFPEVVDSDTRKELQNRVFGLPYFIPSLETFHRDTMHFSVAVKAVKKWIVPDLDADLNPGSTLRDILAQHFRPDNIWQEQAGGQWRQANGVTLDNPGKAFDFAYRQLILAALRRFAELTNESPTQERRQERLQGCVSKTGIDNFMVTAKKLGFLTPKVVQDKLQNAVPPTARASHPPFHPQPDTFGNDTTAYPRTWNGGRPPISIYLYLQSYLFDQNLVEEGPPAHHEAPSALYIQKSVISAFLGGYSSYCIPEVTMTEAFDNHCETKRRDSVLFADDDESMGPLVAEEPQEGTQTACKRTSEVGYEISPVFRDALTAAHIGEGDLDGHRSALLETFAPKEEDTVMVDASSHDPPGTDFAVTQESGSRSEGQLLCHARDAYRLPAFSDTNFDPDRCRSTFLGIKEDTEMKDTTTNAPVTHRTQRPREKRLPVYQFTGLKTELKDTKDSEIKRDPSVEGEDKDVKVKRESSQKVKEEDNIKSEV